MPVPCVRDLWEPVANTEWRRRLRSVGGKCDRRDNLSIEDLRLCHQTQESLADSQTARIVDDGSLVQWCEGADELGTLVWMAVMLERRL